MNRLDVKITFLLDSPHHITSDRVSFGIDKTLCVDPRNNKTSIVPATSLKGVIRYNTEIILRSRGKKVCIAPNPAYMCKTDDLCILCNFFGNPRKKAILIFEDAKIGESKINSRMGVGIERRRKIAKKDHLFSYELGFGKSFTTTVRGIFLRKEDVVTACALLYIGAKSSFAIGSGKSRGLGWMNLNSFKAEIDGEELPIEEINKKVKEVLQ